MGSSSEGGKGLRGLGLMGGETRLSRVFTIKGCYKKADTFSIGDIIVCRIEEWEKMRRIEEKY